MKYHGKEMETEHPEGCVAMTWEDAMEMEKENQDHKWGFTVPALLRLIADHMEAFWDSEDGKNVYESERCMEKIEWRLDDANFHTLSERLNGHSYKEALKLIKDDME